MVPDLEDFFVLSFFVGFGSEGWAELEQDPEGEVANLAEELGADNRTGADAGRDVADRLSNTVSEPRL